MVNHHELKKTFGEYLLELFSTLRSLSKSSYSALLGLVSPIELSVFV